MRELSDGRRGGLRLAPAIASFKLVGGHALRACDAPLYAPAPSRKSGDAYSFVHSPGFDGGFKLSNCGVWLGSAGNVTPLHYDLCHGFLIGVLGTKVVTYYGGSAYAEQDEVSLPAFNHCFPLLVSRVSLHSSRGTGCRKHSVTAVFRHAHPQGGS